MNGEQQPPRLIDLRFERDDDEEGSWRLRCRFEVTRRRGHDGVFYQQELTGSVGPYGPWIFASLSLGNLTSLALDHIVSAAAVAGEDRVVRSFGTLHVPVHRPR